MSTGRLPLRLRGTPGAWAGCLPRAASRLLALNCPRCCQNAEPSEESSALSTEGAGGEGGSRRGSVSPRGVSTTGFGHPGLPQAQLPQSRWPAAPAARASVGSPGVLCSSYPQRDVPREAPPLAPAGGSRAGSPEAVQEPGQCQWDRGVSTPRGLGALPGSAPALGPGCVPQSSFTTGSQPPVIPPYFGVSASLCQAFLVTRLWFLCPTCTLSDAYSQVKLSICGEIDGY